MQYRTFGNLGWEVSAIGFGAWGIGGQWGTVTDEEALGALATEVDAGVNFIDTADAYGEPVGRSEELVGRFLKQRSESLYVATKVGNFARRDGHPLAFTSPLHVQLCCDASLHRLQLDTIDLYQCHIGNLEDPGIFLEAFAELKRRGKIRAGGISTNSLDAAKAFHREGTCASVQLDYSLLNRAPEADLLPWCAQQGIATIVRGPLAMGVLAGKFSADSHFDDWPRRSWNEGAGRERFLARLATTDQLRFLESGQRTLAQAALQFVLANPAVSLAIPGAKNPAQAKANAAAADSALTADELAKARELTA